MAKYRQLYTEFWSDSFVLELTCEEKLFYLYLLTNNKTSQCGIYELSKKFIEMETSLTREAVEKLINRFCDYNKILYCDNTKEIMVINWMKYNVPNNNINIVKCIQHELKKIKNKEFLEILFEKYQAAQLDAEKIFDNLIITKSFAGASTIDNASVNCSSSKVICMEIENSKIRTNNVPAEIKEIHKPLTRGLQEAYEPVVSNRIRSNKQEVIIKKQELINKEEEVLTKEEVIEYKNSFSADANSLKTIIKIFEENIHAITPLVYEKILDFTTHVSSKVIILAIHEAVNYNAKTIKYISQILNSWISKGIKTVEHVIAYQSQWVGKKNKEQECGDKGSGFCDYEQRTYDFDALEKQLLGTA